MKKVILILAIFAGFWGSVNGQQVSPQVIASSGNHAENGGYSVSWTLGEPVIETFTETNNILTQGFQQTQLTIVAITNSSIENISVNVYPNPASEFLIIECNGAETEYIINLYDMAGRKLTNKEITANNQKYSVNMSAFASAQYILEVQAKDGSFTKIFHVTKADIK